MNTPIRLQPLFFASLIAFAGFGLHACYDNSDIVYNSYTVESVLTPVDDVGQTKSWFSSEQAQSNSGKKVYIGHSLPVNISVTADYDEENIPIQFYLLSVDDVKAVEGGISGVSDIRMYYCYQTPHTVIKQLKAGTHEYGLVINIPAEQSKDELTTDFKTGNYYVVADVDANDQAEIDAYIVYERFKDRLDEDNIIFVASDYMKKPDLSVEDMNLTGTEERPQDSITFYEVDMSKLPGAQATGLPSFYIKPSKADRTFHGTVNIKSSSADTLNVPIKFFLESKNGSFSIPLTIYDKDMGGFMEEYYIPIIKKNTVESVTLQFRLPNDKTGYYFSTYGSDRWDQDAWDSEDQEDFPLFRVFYEMTQQGLIEGNFVEENISVNHVTENQSPSKDFTFKLKAVVNPDGKITESRFVKPNEDNSEYTTEHYLEDGDEFSTLNATPLITLENNSRREDLILRLEKIFVEPNEGVKFYPCSKIDADGDGDVDEDDCAIELEYRQMVIFWAGWGAHVGHNNLGAGFDIWAGTFFRNYSLFSLGYNLFGHVSDFLTGGDLVSAEGGYRMSFMSESHPFDADNSFYEFVVIGSYLPVGPISTLTPGGEVEWGSGDDWWAGSVSLFTFKDEAQGFGEYEVNTPITFSKFSISLSTTVAGIGIQFTIAGGYGGIYILPRTKAFINRDGSLRFDVGAIISMGVEAELAATALDLASVGVNGSIDIVSFDVGLGVFTKVYYDEVNHPGQARGSIGFGPSIWFIGPQGTMNLYVELPLLFATVRIEQTILSFQAFKVKIYDDPFFESDKTGWVDLERPELVDYNLDELNYD